MNDIEDDGFVTVYDSAGAPRGRVIGHSRAEGARKAEGHLAARSGGASDLPELRSQEELDRMCPPCNGDCRQGRDCPAWVKRELPHGWWIGPGAVLCLGLLGVIAWMVA